MAVTIPCTNPKCDGYMTINDYNGWRFECPFCGKEGRKAKNEEVEQNESN